MKSLRPKCCYGAAPSQHAAYCRPGRPRCRWRRREAGICSCGAYHYPHRTGSGRCGNLEAQDHHAHGPASEARALAYEALPHDAPSHARNVFADLLERDCVAGGA